MEHSSPGDTPKQASHAQQPYSLQRQASPAIIEYPDPHDIILGRGSANSWRPGNSHLHQIVDDWQERYHSTRNRKDKAEIVQMIYQRLKGFGRFLKQIKGSDAYEEVSTKVAMEKIAHTLRDRKTKEVKPTAPVASVVVASGESRLSYVNIGDTQQSALPSSLLKAPPATQHPGRELTLPQHEHAQIASTAGLFEKHFTWSSGPMDYPDPDIAAEADSRPKGSSGGPSHGDDEVPAAGGKPSSRSCGDSACSDATSNLFSDGDLRSVLGHPHEYLQGSPDRDISREH